MKAQYYEIFLSKKNLCSVNERYFFSANKRTIIICMLGIVPVQVIGSVRASEFLYAAPGNPGLAISGYHLRRDDKVEANLVGIAVNSIETKDELLVGLFVIQCAK